MTDTTLQASWNCPTCPGPLENHVLVCPTCATPRYQSWQIMVAEHILELVRDGEQDPLAILKILQAKQCYASTTLSLAFVSNQLRVTTRMLRQLTDTRPQAKAALAGAALEMAHSVIECDDPKVHLAALKGLRVIDETEGSGLTIIVGAGGAVQVNIGEGK